ncbi:MAG: hypothetical protein JHD35_19170 [Sphingopyxis sp.]|nr:hypothetical protein [Sphingopyxis sp.]
MRAFSTMFGGMAAAIALPFAAQAQAPGSGDDLEYVTEYTVMIGAEDRVSSAGTTLSEPAAILKQNRYNFHVRGINQTGDSPDNYFGDKTHRAEIGKAAVEFGDDGAHANLVNGTFQLFVTAMRPKGGGRLTLFVATSDGEPADDSADDPDAGATSMPASADQIPVAFHDRWAASPSACTLDGSLEVLSIDGAGVHQAEGEMLVTHLERANNGARITIDARNSGGGEEWESTEEFFLSPDGKTLDWRQLRPGNGQFVSRLTRCDDD